MKKAKRILALAGVFLLIGMYAATLFLALFGSESTQGWLMASIVMTVIVPVLLYAMRLIARLFSGRHEEEAFDKAEKEKAGGHDGSRDKT